MTVFQFPMLIPPVAIPGGTGEFDEADPTFNEAAGKETLETERFRIFVIGIETVKLFRRVCFPAKIHEIGDCGLHAKRGLVILNRRFDLRVGLRLPHRSPIEFTEKIEFSKLIFL